LSHKKTLDASVKVLALLLLLLLHAAVGVRGVKKGSLEVKLLRPGGGFLSITF
jgi:hypothetical protein